MPPVKFVLYFKCNSMSQAMKSVCKEKTQANSMPGVPFLSKHIIYLIVMQNNNNIITAHLSFNNSCDAHPTFFSQQDTKHTHNTTVNIIMTGANNRTCFQFCNLQNYIQIRNISYYVLVIDHKDQEKK